MYVKPISIRLLRGRSTPAILGMSPPSSWQRQAVLQEPPATDFLLTLSLFVFGVFADHVNHALALDDLALWAAAFYRWRHFHSWYLPFRLVPFHARCVRLTYRWGDPIGQWIAYASVLPEAGV
jgi:hypothetical protein